MVRRRSLWEGPPDLEAIIRVEFRDRMTDGPDLHVSIYDVRDEFPRLHAEHMAGSNLRPPGQANTQVDVSGLFVMVPRVEAGEVPFTFARDAHRCLDFGSIEELESFVRALAAAYGDREHRVRWQDIRSYVQQCVQNADQEWLPVIAAQPDWRKWLPAT